jgi:hypothetical protein
MKGGSVHNLPLRPQRDHLYLLQLPRRQRIETISEGLALIVENALILWREANEVSGLGRRRAVGILQAFAEEEAAKALLLFDSLRCPENQRANREALLRQFDKHLAKGIYAYYYNTRPADMREVSQIIEGERRLFYREGEYGEFIAPNWILHNREAKLYVSYLRNGDGSHRWWAPYPADDLWGDIVPSGIVRVAQALSELRLFTPPRLSAVSDFWNTVAFVEEDPDPMAAARNPDFSALNVRTFETLEASGIAFAEAEAPKIETVVDGLLFPLYPFDLSNLDNFGQLPPPDEPEL